MQKMMTKTLARQLPPLYSTDGQGDAATVRFAAIGSRLTRIGSRRSTTPTRATVSAWFTFSAMSRNSVTSTLTSSSG